MQRRIVHSVLTVILFGIIGTSIYLNHLASASVGVSKNAAEAIQRYGFFLTERAAKSGIDFVHEAPTLDVKLANIMPEIASMGAAVSIVDYDRDGYDDIYVTNSAIGSQNHLYHNLHNGLFRDVAPELGLADLNKPGTGVCTGAVWGDYDNDGYPDLLVYKWGKPLLFHNEHGRAFTDVTASANLPPWINANSATWVDYDRDGKLDLLICGYYPETLDLWHLKNTRMMPSSFEYANNGGRKFLLRNMGNGKFEDVTSQTGLNSTRWTLAVATTDLTGSGYPDIIFANDYGTAQIFHNILGKKFIEVGKQTGIGYRPRSGMNASLGDFQDSGKLALYISNINDPGNLIQGNNLWVPEPTHGKSIPHFDDYAVASGVDDGGWSFGAQFVDLSNSGWLDIFLTNGYISADRDRSYWSDFSKISGGNDTIIKDAAYWPTIGTQSLSGYQEKRVWLNDGFGHFTNVAPGVGVTDLHDGRSVAVSDLWNNGAEDVLVANQKGPFLLYKNSVNPKNNWIEFELQGTKCNRDAIGARLTLFWHTPTGDLEQVQEVASASGFCAQNSHRLHFGLGQGGYATKAVIDWPEIPMKEQIITAPKLNAINKVIESH